MSINRFRGSHFFLSNFYFCFVNLDGELYPSVEHAYQAAKTLNKSKRFTIQTAKDPATAKRLGRRVSHRRDWKEVKLSVMEGLLKQKFSDGELRQRLINTGNEEIIEGNTWGDTFWGVCNGKGENQLGKLLMKIREEIKCAAHS